MDILIDICIVLVIVVVAVVEQSKISERQRKEKEIERKAETYPFRVLADEAGKIINKYPSDCIMWGKEENRGREKALIELEKIRKEIQDHDNSIRPHDFYDPIKGSSVAIKEFVAGLRSKEISYVEHALMFYEYGADPEYKDSAWDFIHENADKIYKKLDKLYFSHGTHNVSTYSVDWEFLEYRKLADEVLSILDKQPWYKPVSIEKYKKIFG